MCAAGDISDAGVITSNDLTLSEHSRPTTGWVMVGWVMPTFKTRETKSMMALFKILIPSRILLCTIITLQGERSCRIRKCNREHPQLKVTSQKSEVLLHFSGAQTGERPYHNLLMVNLGSLHSKSVPHWHDRHRRM